MIDDEIQDYLFQKNCKILLAPDWQDQGIVVVNMTTNTSNHQLHLNITCHPAITLHWVFLFLLSFVLFDYLALE